MSSGSSTAILCNQENFLLKANGYIIKQALPDEHILFKPAEKDYLEGRPKNGMFIDVPDVMKENVADISPSHWRIQAALIKKKNSKIMIINSYFPQDSNSLTTLDPQLEELIAAIKLVKAWDSFQIDFTHEFEKDQMTFTCNIDYFFWNTNLNNKVLEAGVLHLPDNLSEHSPIYCKFHYDYAEQEEKTHVSSSNRALKLNWESLTQTQKDGINHNIEERMLHIHIPFPS